MDKALYSTPTEPRPMLSFGEYSRLIREYADSMLGTTACRALVDMFVTLVNASPFRRYAHLPCGERISSHSRCSRSRC